MSNEAKRDVFEIIADKCAGYNDELYEDLLRQYDDALPDNLPVIPKVWGDTIEEFKANHYRLSEMFSEWDWNYDEQELIARAWLDGFQTEE
ncbi:hypothetical protein [Pediococcus pentosaceus]|uniref:hypothetical protein n=1 Tax=Pediococcus pentosaceus TaxID=1255 RepID=UPI0018FE5EFA|nr:hypothetical protein [Pediococcus pentosaceus]MBF7122779.1 hypothetical protein [Pediococcus pentosaceus]